MRLLTSLAGALILSPILLVTNATTGSGLTVSDSDFVDANWSHALVWGSATVSAAQQLTGGNPGSFQSGSHYWGPGSIGYAHFFTGGSSYDPASQGTIGTMSFSMDFIVTSARFAAGGSTDVAATLLVKQDTSYYLGVTHYVGGIPAFFNFSYGDPWTSGSYVFAESDFAQLTPSGILVGTPDFSTSGSPMSFGYATLNTTGYTNNSNTWGIDNFSVTINSIDGDGGNNTVPEPATLLLLGTGLVGLAAYRRKLKTS